MALRLRRLRLPVLAGCVAALALVSVGTTGAAPAAAKTVVAAGASLRFDGGNRFERAQVTAALRASSFDWGVVPWAVTVHIVRGADSAATPRQVWLDADLLDAGEFSWGVVQHEFAHQVDFGLFGASVRDELQRSLGATTWCSETPGSGHAQSGCERFASTLAWAYWPVPENCMRPASPSDESAAMRPAAFRALLAGILRRPAVRTLEGRG